MIRCLWCNRYWWFTRVIMNGCCAWWVVVYDIIDIDGSLGLGRCLWYNRHWWFTRVIM